MSTHNIGFYEDLTKIVFELSSNMHPISSAVFIGVFLASKGSNFSELIYLHFS